MDIRQTREWGNYLSQIGWTVKNLGETQVFIRPFPLIRHSAIKIQHPKNPLPFPDIDSLAKTYRALFVLIEPEPAGFDERDFIKNGYQKSGMSLTHTLTIHLDLGQPPQELLASFSENARRNIKKSQSNNLKVEKIFLKDEKNDDEFKKFYALLTNLTKLKKFYVPSYKEFHKKMLAFNNSSVLLFAYPSASSGQVSEPIAAVWLGILGDSAVYMNTGITEKGYELLANYLLVWESLQLARKLKLKLFDFEGLFDPRFPKHRPSWKKFSEFKKRFHGTLVEYPQPWIKWHNKPLNFFYRCSKIFSS